jgi:hypothetical protein
MHFTAAWTHLSVADRLSAVVLVDEAPLRNYENHEEQGTKFA